MRHRVSFLLPLAAAVAVGAGWVGFRVVQGQHSAAAASSLSYWAEAAGAGTVVSNTIRALGAVPVAARERSSADLVVLRSPTSGATGILPASTGSPVSPLSGAQIVKAERKPSYYAAVGPHAAQPELVKRVVSRLAQPAAASGSDWTMDVVGDIGLGRSIYTGMLARHDFDYPFRPFQPELHSADLTLANLECALSDDHAVISDSGMTFVTPYQAAQGLKDSGIDAVSVANNHSFNGGAAGYTDTLTELGRLGVKPFGGGNNDTEAHQARIIKVKGLRVALLGYSAIVGSQPAGASSPGMAFISMAPWGPFSESDVSRMESDIKAARSQADLVFVYYHWGTEYTHDANADQRTVAHRAIDAGADLVLGAHPHWTQGVEWYNGHLIAYSLGNFIFDQAWSDETRRSAMLKVTFQGTRLQTARFVPYDIIENSTPQPASGASAGLALSDIYSHSWWPSTP